MVGLGVGGDVVGSGEGTGVVGGLLVGVAEGFGVIVGRGLGGGRGHGVPRELPSSKKSESKSCDGHADCVAMAATSVGMSSQSELNLRL